MKRRLLLKMITFSFAMLLFLPLVGNISSAAATSVQLGFNYGATDFSQNPAPAAADPGAYTIYLPLVLRNYPIQTIFGAEMAQLTTTGGLDKMNAAKITWTRRNGVLWSSVEPTEGTRDWNVLSGLESELKDASEKGLQVVLIVLSTPEWARKNAGSGAYCGPIAANKLAAFGSFMHDLVARYSVPPYNVKYWELWNEPDIDPSLVSPSSGFGCWGDNGDAYYGGGYYGEMLKAVYPQIKAANPQAQVLVGGLLLDCDPRPGAGCASVGGNSLPPKFLEGILNNNGGAYFDGVSFHAYDYYGGQMGSYGASGWQSTWNTTGPVAIAKADYIKSLLSQYEVPGKFLMNTESAIICSSCTNDPTFETTKTYYIAQVYAAAIAEGVKANIWYSVMGWRNSGLLNYDLSPRPAYTALQFSREELGDARWVRNITEYTGVKGYEFLRDGQSIWVIWSMDGATHSVDLPALPESVWDVMGSSITPADPLDVSLAPLYLEWNP